MSDERRVNSCDIPAGCKYAESIAQQASDMATRKTMAILGVDLDDPASVEAFRQDLRFGGRMRKIAEKGMMTFIGVVATAVSLYIVEILRGRL